MSAFDYHDRSAPRIPDHTCPAIDAAINEIDTAAAALSELTGRRGALEELRKENEALRECGVYWRETAKSLAEDVDRLESECSDLQHERDALLSEVRSLEAELKARAA